MRLWIAYLAVAAATWSPSPGTLLTGFREELYGLLSADEGILSTQTTQDLAMASGTRCAAYCTSNAWCLAYSVELTTPNEVECRFSSLASPRTTARTGSRIYTVGPTGAVSSSCTDPPLDNSSLYSCNGSPTFEAAAMLRMGSNRAILFTTENSYIACSSMNNIVEQGAEYCSPKQTLPGDSYLDPYGFRFQFIPPDGAVGYIRSNMVECRYYLFKGNDVYCYQHMDAEPWMTICSSWESMTIQERFGEGIPSYIDDVFGNFNYNHDFYFIKDNLVYLSTGNSTVGSLAPGYPKHIHEEFPNMMCNITGVQLGLNPGEFYYTKGMHVYKEVDGVVYYKKYLCN